MDEKSNTARGAGAAHRAGEPRRRRSSAGPGPDRNPDAKILDCFPIGVIVVDARGRPRFMNLAAKEILGQDDGIAVACGRLRAASDQETPELRRLIGEAARAGDGEKLGEHGAMTLSRLSPGTPLSVLVMPLLGDGHGAADGGATAAVFVSDPERQPELRQDALVGLYGLTAAEARLVEALARGRSLDHVADGLGITRETVRTHLRRIYSKTDTHRQAELVSLVLCGPAAVRA